MTSSTAPVRDTSARERDALARLRSARQVHTRMIGDRRYMPPELQADLARRAARQRRDVRAFVAIIRRERATHQGSGMARPQLPDLSTLVHAAQGHDPAELVEWIDNSALTMIHVRGGLDLYSDIVEGEVNPESL